MRKVPYVMLSWAPLLLVLFASGCRGDGGVASAPAASGLAIIKREASRIRAGEAVIDAAGEDGIIEFLASFRGETASVLSAEQRADALLVAGHVARRRLLNLSGEFVARAVMAAPPLHRAEALRSVEGLVYVFSLGERRWNLGEGPLYDMQVWCSSSNAWPEGERRIAKWLWQRLNSGSAQGIKKTKLECLNTLGSSWRARPTLCEGSLRAARLNKFEWTANDLELLWTAYRGGMGKRQLAAKQEGVWEIEGSPHGLQFELARILSMPDAISRGADEAAALDLDMQCVQHIGVHGADEAIARFAEVAGIALDYSRERIVEQYWNSDDAKVFRLVELLVIRGDALCLQQLDKRIGEWGK